MNHDAIPISPNRIGLFATAVSFLALLSGTVLHIAADFNQSSIKSIATLLFVLGGLGVVFSYLIVRSYFWTFRPSLAKSKPGPAQASSDSGNLSEQGGMPRVPFFAARQKNPVGIGGWLFFPILGLVVAPLYGVSNLAQTIPLLGNWSGLSDGGKAIVLAEGVASLGLGIFAPIYLLIKLKAKSEVFPIRWIVWALTFAAFNIIDVLAVYLLLKDQFDTGKLVLFDRDTVRTLTQSVVATIIWVPYMHFSKRVRNTFIEGGSS